MLKELVKERRYSFHTQFERWEDAVRASIQPLVEEGAVDPEYGDNIVETVKKYGPYIIICPDVCLPHAEDKSHVHETAVSLMVCKKPVLFGSTPEEGARLFFAVASTDDAHHLENLKSIMKLLERPDALNELIAAESPGDILALAEKTGL